MKPKFGLSAQSAPIDGSLRFVVILSNEQENEFLIGLQPVLEILRSESSNSVNRLSNQT